MAYTTKYIAKIFGKPKLPGSALTGSGLTGIMYIQQDGYIGYVKPQLKLKDLEIKTDFDDWFNPIIQQQCTFQIFNDSSDLYYYDDLMTMNEKEFKVIIDASMPSSPTNVRLFEGFINTNTINTKYTWNTPITFTASNYLNMLDKVHPDIIDDVSVSRNSLIDIINQCLLQTGKTSDIYVNNTLDPGINMPGNKTVFNVCGVDNELFWKNNYDRESSKKIIETILRTLDSYIYWWNGNWYIVRYNDAWDNDGTFNYKIYYDTSTYNYNSICPSINLYEPSTNLNDLNIGKNTYGRGIIPGFKEFTVNLNEKLYLNMANPYFFATSFEGTSAVPYPAIRGWQYNTNNVTDAIRVIERSTTPFKEIQNCVKIMTWGWAWSNDDGWGTNDYLKGYGIATRFLATVTDSSEGPTELNIKWKWNNASSPGCSSYWKNSHCKGYRIWYYLRNPIGNYYIMYDEENDKWYRAAATAENAAQYIDIGSDAVNQDTGTAECSVTIPLSDVSGGVFGDQEYVVGLSQGQYNFDGTYNWELYNRLGDVEITLSVPKQDNVYKFEINSKVLNTESTDLDLFDISNLNYKNGLYTGPSFATRTESWTDKDKLQYYPLCKWLGVSRFSLYHKSRTKLSGVCLVNNKFLKPFSMFWDSRDPSTRKFLLTSYTFKPFEDKYDCEWTEYSTDLTNLNDW